MIKFSVKQALLNLLLVDVHLPKVVKDHPELNDLVQFIVNHKSLVDDNTPYPNIKEAAEATNVDYNKARKQIRKLYGLMFPFMDSPYLEFNKVEYELYFFYFENLHYMLIDHFPVPFRVGEKVTMPFLKAKLGTDRFHVTDICHHFERNIQRIEVTLKGGAYKRR